MKNRILFPINRNKDKFNNMFTMRKYIQLLTFLLCVYFGPLSAQSLPTPTKVQLEWQRMETIGFVHFSVNTYTDMEWGYGNESPSIFNPTHLDCRQWARTFKEAGLKGIILTAKHHDGFCLWPSAYTEHSVKHSPWKNGKGDLVREFADACREYGLEVGLYLSPWDCNHPDYGKPEYITYFKNQLRELLTNYGELFEFWFDGANGGRGYYSTDSLHMRSIAKDYYPWKEITEMVYELQPNCVVHGGDLANIRWVGNEQGYALEEHWSMMGAFDPKIKSNIQLMTGHANGTVWKPSETDVSIRPGWYYHASEDHKLHSLAKLMDIYYNSVGRNSLLLLNIPPNQEGLIDSNDSLRLVQWRQLYTKELSCNLLNQKMNIASGDSKKLKKCMDNNANSYWEAPNLTPTIEIDFKKELLFNRLMLQEYIPQGQRVKAFSVEYCHRGKWNPLAEQTTIGYKRILRLPETMASRIRIHIKDALAVPQIAEIQLFYAETQLDKPIIKRKQNGSVYMQTASKNAMIYYTTNGTTPSEQNGKLYQKPFAADGTQRIKAITIDGKKKSEISERQFTYSKSQWTTTPVQAANNIFDENEFSSWISPKDCKELIVDLHETVSVKGLSYLPDQARYARGIIVKYTIEVSTDGILWETVIPENEFANIQNSPVEQNLIFSKPIVGRYLRFKALSTVNNQNNIGIAEFNIIISR